jgi:hypothetical protein
MKRILLLSFCLTALLLAQAARITGLVTDASGKPLAYASLIIKGTSRGTVAGSQGRYSLEIGAGTYTLVCQYIGYRAQEQKVTIGNDDVQVNFQLQVQEFKMEEVVIKRGEDPAIAIMKQAIKKRNFYNDQVDSFSVDVYVKGLIRSVAVPDRFMGQKVDKKDMEKQGFDSLGRGILFLSESQTKVSFKRPGKIKYEVVSSRQSGGGYGISFPFFINFYTNNVSVFNNNLNPRGFISPVSDNAFHYYNFHYEGNFFENNQMIDRIRVTPKRKNEPLFQGYIQIVDGDWRIHSLDLTTTKQYGLELIDTLRIAQIHAPVEKYIWRTQNQVVYIAANTFGFQWSGNFLNVYNNYNLRPGFGKKYFNRITMSYDTAFNKKDSSYWNNLRPVPLEVEEKKDFAFRDSAYKRLRDSGYTRTNVDSMNKKRKPVKPTQVLLGGFQRQHYSTNGTTTYRFNGIVRELEYNTVEGLTIKAVQSLTINPKRGKTIVDLGLNARYGVSNEHLNAFGGITLRPRSESFRNRYLYVSGGKRVEQINHDNPITPLVNSVYTLLYKRNYLKIYENRFGSVTYNNSFENGLHWNINATYEDRIPLENTTDYSFGRKYRTFLPNHPYELANIPFNRQQALEAMVVLSYQPGQHYIQFPTDKVPLGSKYPTFELAYTKGFKDLLGSDVDFDKWKLSVFDELNLKLGGVFKYRISVGGFLNRNAVGLPDYTHFIGNQTYRASAYLNSFQLAPYYRYSNVEPFYLTAHAEHHFNGLITNKIPLLNKLKWNLVAGANTFYVNRDNYYAEVFAGLENIFKLFRLDLINAYQPGLGNRVGVRLGLGGIIGGKVRISR